MALENAICALPGVDKAAVVDVKHPKFQERPVRVIQMASEAKEEEKPSLVAVRKFLGETGNFAPGAQHHRVQAARRRVQKRSRIAEHQPYVRQVQSAHYARLMTNSSRLPYSDDAVGGDGVASTTLSHDIQHRIHAMEEDSRHKSHVNPKLLTI